MCDWTGFQRFLRLIQQKFYRHYYKTLCGGGCRWPLFSLFCITGSFIFVDRTKSLYKGCNLNLWHCFSCSSPTAIISTKKQICKTLFSVSLCPHLFACSALLYSSVTAIAVVAITCTLFSAASTTYQWCIHHLGRLLLYSRSRAIPSPQNRLHSSSVFFFLLLFHLWLPNKHMCDSFTCCVFRK